MTNIILGMSEVGETLFYLLKEINYNYIGIDTDNSKCKNYSVKDQIENT